MGAKFAQSGHSAFKVHTDGTQNLSSECQIKIQHVPESGITKQQK
jgi:hypothetical protein